MWRAFRGGCIRRRFYATPNLNLDAVRSRTLDRDLKEGTEVEGFLVNKVALVPEFNMTMVRLRHVRTGCDHLHLVRDDDNNVFSANFRTTPTDSSGLPHILEHTTLCGSTRYPCRDPFFKMLNRSMATFMNALTGPDYTLYPFATLNKTDYSNLMSVYMDAVFRPRLRELDFKQEGWRLEHEVVTNKDTPIVIKGIVYNEMKGVFSDNQTVFGQALLNSILPSHTYGVISGGDPKAIPSLSYEDLKIFHKKYYHPSNCRLYTYGNFPLTDTLQFVNKAYLNDYPDTTDYAKLTKVPSEPRWESEKRKHISCRPDPMACNPRKQSSIAISTLCNDIRATQETFVMQVISELLVSGPNSAFYKSLVEPNIGGGFSPVTGYDSQTRDSLFAVGLVSVEPNDFDRIIDIYHKTLDKVVEEGFDENHVKAILHTIELNTKHQTTDFGLNMLFSLAPVWNHDGDLLSAIQVGEKVLKLKKAMTDNPTYLQDIVQEYFKENSHRLVLTMSPDEDYVSKEQEFEANILKERISSLSPSQRDHVFSQGLELMRDQEAKQDVNCLPSLSTNDLSRELERVSPKGYLLQKVPVQYCSIPTNGVTYVRGVINTSILSEDAKALLPLFCSIITKMGTEQKNYYQLDQAIKMKTGGLSMSTHIAENLYDAGSYEEGIVFSSFCLDRNIQAMADLLGELFCSAKLEDEKRFENLVKLTANNILHGIADNGHLYAMSTASSFVSPSSAQKEQFAGLSFVHAMKELSGRTNLSNTLELMAGIASVILNKRKIRVAINTGPEMEEKVLPHMDAFVREIPGEFKKPFELTNPSGSKPTSGNFSIFYELPYQLSNAAHCFPTVSYSHSQYPALRVLGRLLRSKYLLPIIREKGGAYGAGANLSTCGTFSFYSYRDPSPNETLNVFNRAASWVREGNFTEQDVEEAKLGVFQSIDAPIPPGSKGIRNFLYGISDDELQQHREAIMRLKKFDLTRAAPLLDSKLNGRAILGPPNEQILNRPEENWERRLAE